MNARIFIKHLISAAIYYSGMFKIIMAVHNLFGRRLTILLYHRLTEKEIDQISDSLSYLFTKKNSFEKQLKLLKKYYHITNFQSISQRISKGKRIRNNTLIITFDDGYEDNFTNGYDVLKKFNIPAVIFICPGKIERNNDTVYWWDFIYSLLNKNDEDPRINNIDVYSRLNNCRTKEIERLVNEIEGKNRLLKSIKQNNKIMNWTTIRTMKDKIEYGSHTYNHINLVAADEEERKNEIINSKNEIENRIGYKICSFSYPAGIYSNKIKEIVKKAGYEFAVTTKKGINSSSNAHELKRITIWEGACRNQNGKFSKSIFMLQLLGF